MSLPKDAVILNELHIVEYMTDEGTFWDDVSRAGDGDDLTFGKALELIERARAIQITPLIADVLHEYVFEGDDEDEDYA